MTDELRAQVTFVLGTLISVAVIVGMACRWILLPYLRDHLVAPVSEVRKQVSENHHSNAEPTLPDRIDDLHTQVASRHDQIADQVTALAGVLDGHLVSSERWLDYLLRRLDGENPPPHGPAGGA